MPFRLIIHIPRSAIRVAFYALLAGVIAFFALTRTQLGRDGLRDQLVQEFNENFGGTLAIGKLEGNLVNTLFASDITLHDPEGRLLLGIDSLIVEHRWQDLFRRQVSVRRLTLLQPRLNLHRSPDTTWNLPPTLRQTTRDTTRVASRWTFASAEIVVVDGTVTTSNGGALPEAVGAGHLFDYTRADVTGINGEATIDWLSDVRQVDILNLTASLDSTFSLHNLQGQLVVADDRLALNQFALEAGGSTLYVSGSVDSLSALQAGDFARVGLDVNLLPSRLVADDARVFLPTLPVADQVQAALRLHGPVADLTLESLELERRATRLALTGTLKGLPDSLAFSVAMEDNFLADADLRAVAPTLNRWPGYSLDTLTVDLNTRGTVPVRAEAPPLRAEADFTLRGPAGRTTGRISIADTAGLNYRASLVTQSLDVSRFATALSWDSRLNGSIDLEGRGLRRDSLNASASLHLFDSYIASRYLDSLNLDLGAQRGYYEARAGVAQFGGALYAAGFLDDTGPSPRFALEAQTRAFDLGPLLLNDSLATSLNARLALTGHGVAGPNLSGEAVLRFDSSATSLGPIQRSIPPHQTTLTLEPQWVPGPRLILGGDVAAASIDGEVDFRAVRALGKLWRQAFAEAVRNETTKPYRAPYSAIPSLANAEKTGLLRDAARAALVKDLDSTLTLAADARLVDATILTSLFPALPLIESNLRAHADLRAGAHEIRLEGSVYGDSLLLGSLRTHGVEARLDLSGHLRAPLERTLVTFLEVDAEDIFLGKQHLDAPQLRLAYADQGGELILKADPYDALGPVRLSVSLDLLPTRNRFTLNEFFLAAEDYTWANTVTPHIDLYSDALVVPNLVLENHRADTDEVQRIRVHGTVSSAPLDTIFVDTQNIALYPISDLLSMRYPLGGLLNGKIAFTGGSRRPEVTGDLHLATLSLDNRILGDLRVTSRVVPGQPDVGLEVDLTPVPDSLTLDVLPGTDRPAVVEPNRLHLAGSFRLPQFDPQGQQIAPSNQDFTLQIDRADLFFFDYIFQKIERVGGYVAGNGTIRGPLRNPVIEARMEAREASFDLPHFNLRLAAEGGIHIDGEAIHLDSLRITDPTNGYADVQGKMLFNDYRYFSYDLNGTLHDMQIMNVARSDTLPFYGSIWASGDATLTGPQNSALLRSPNVVTSSRSELFIPITEEEALLDVGFIIFADSTGEIPDIQSYTRRANILSRRAKGERTFADGLDMDLNIFVPGGSTIHLVFDPLLGDVISAQGSGRIQFQRTGGEYETFGTLTVDGGSYLFTAGEVFVRRFYLEPGGTISWDGDPINAQLDLPASFRTRASPAGLPNATGVNQQALIPLIVQLQISGRVVAPEVDLSLAIDRGDLNVLGNYQALEAQLNQPERSTEYATSVLLTNSFRLTTDNLNPTNSGGQLAFTSVSQLVSSQLNRFLNEALPNVDFTFGVQGDNAQDLDVTYGVALRLLDERLIIRGEGVYQGSRTSTSDTNTENLQGEFVVEVRLNPNVSVEVFYRRESDILTENAALTNTTGAGLSYQTEFSSWRTLFTRLFGWMRPSKKEEPPPADAVATKQE